MLLFGRALLRRVLLRKPLPHTLVSTCTGSSLILAWLLYPSYAKEAFRLLECRSVDDRRWLVADMRVDCAWACVRTCA